MEEKAVPKYLLVEAAVLPEVFVKVTQVKELLETGEVKTVAEAVERVGISRSAFYKYKDSVVPFRDMKHGSIVTFHALLRDRKGVLSSLLAIFADTGANILTINQSIPTNGAALVTISATTENMPIGVDELIARVRGLDGYGDVDAAATRVVGMLPQGHGTFAAVDVEACAVTHEEVDIDVAAAHGVDVAGNRGSRHS